MLCFGSIFCEFQVFNDVVSVQALAVFPFIRRANLFTLLYYSMPIHALVEFLIVQDKPNFETRVGERNTNPGVGALLYRSIHIWVLIAIKHRPDFVILLE